MNELLQLMHDTMNPISTIKSAAKLLREEDLSLADRERLLTAIEERAITLEKVLDAYYVRSKQREL